MTVPEATIAANEAKGGSEKTVSFLSCFIFVAVLATVCRGELGATPGPDLLERQRKTREMWRRKMSNSEAQMSSPGSRYRGGL